MGLEWLESVCAILRSAGIPAGEGYPAGRALHITEPVACVDLEGLEPSAGKVLIEVQILSPGNLGAWQCQQSAVGAVSALETGGMSCVMGKCRYLSGCDCFAVNISCVWIPDPQEEPVPTGKTWKIRMNGDTLAGIMDFTAEQDRERRLLGAVSQRTPISVIPGKGGWSLRLVQKISGGVREADPLTEPFTLQVDQMDVSEVYSGCCWNSIQRKHDDDGLTVTWKGFALTQEVISNG